MYESVDVGGLTPTPSPFLVVDFYNQNRACLLPEKGLPAPGPYSTPLRTPRWNGSNHCRYRPPLPIVGAGGGGGLRGFRSYQGVRTWRRGGGGGGSCLFPSLSLVSLAESLGCPCWTIEFPRVTLGTLFLLYSGRGTLGVPPFRKHLFISPSTSCRGSAAPGRQFTSSCLESHRSVAEWSFLPPPWRVG